MWGRAVADVLPLCPVLTGASTVGWVRLVTSPALPRGAAGGERPGGWRWNRPSAGVTPNVLEFGHGRGGPVGTPAQRW